MKNNNSDFKNSRFIPVPQTHYDDKFTEGFVPMNESDRKAVMSLVKDFMETGVIERPVEGWEMQTLEDLKVLVDEAMIAAKTEEDYDPEYSSEIYDEIGVGGENCDWDNPFEEREECCEDISEKEEKHYVKVRLADGSVVFAELA